MPGNGRGDASALHHKLIEHLKREGHLRDAHVEAAFRAVPRHLFLPEVPIEDVYRDEAIATKREEGRAISSSSQPAMMAIMLEQLQLEPGQHVLEIGAGTGYNAALMAHIVGEAGRVVTLDIDDDLVQNARAHLAAAGYGHVQVVCADGGYGWPGEAPYDRVILTVGVGDIIPAWREQLKLDGRLVLPISLHGAQKSVAFVPAPAGDHLASASVVDCGFMTLRGAFAEPEPFIALGPEPGLYLTAPDPGRVDAEAVYRLLTGPHQDWPTHIRVTPRALWTSLSLWLALHEPELCGLSAEGEWTQRNLVPCLVEIEGRWPFCITSGLLDENGLSVLMRASHSDRQDGSAFELWVRSFGAGEALVQRLKDHLVAWDAAGRPTTDKLHIRAYPAEAEYTLNPGESVIRKHWTHFVLDWR